MKVKPMVVQISMVRCDMWTTHNGRTVRFFDTSEARSFADRNGYTGIRITVAEGYGLKPRLEKLLGQ